ncbi:MAG: hypothetical protein EPO31_01620 [Gammaproteobacteria bacterium]|nr:MAG: hypothetical protein EPO31_01620 [Gammaproteobacteria bacterium]
MTMFRLSLAASDCDRACLEGLVTQYLAALDAHDPSQLPLAPTARFTENTVPLIVGDGFWQTIDKGSQSGNYRLTLADPQSGQVVHFGAAKENGHGVLFGVRLKHNDRRLTEIEQFVARRGPGMIGVFDDPPAFDAAWMTPMPPEQRSTRTELARIANLYFDAIEQDDGDLVPLWDECTRVENAFSTAPMPASGNRPAMSIRESFSSGMFNYIGEIQPRRILLIDEERGVVLGQFMFQHPGNIYAEAFKEQYKDPNSVIVYPNTIAVFEAFKVRGGRIANITAQMISAPYRQPPGWPVEGK